jgi:hypothetical protein
MPPPRFRRKSVKKRRNGKRKSIRRRGSSKIRYSRGGGIERVSALSDLSAPHWFSYQILNKDTNNIVKEGNLKELSNEEKSELYSLYARNKDYFDFMLIPAKSGEEGLNEDKEHANSL